MSLRKYTKDDYHAVKELREQGLTYKAIAPLVGMSRQIVGWMMTRGHRLPDRLPVHFKTVERPKKVNDTGEELFVHDPYYKF